jgi:hypothetical protein
MRRELFTHFLFWLCTFVLIILFKQYFDLSYWPFVLGGLIGVFLPDIDHFIYVYFIKPQDLSSQRVNYYLEKKDTRRAIELLYETRNERKDLVFHSLMFEGIFFVLMFFILSSSGSYFGRGLVISFIVHLLVDHLIDIREYGGLSNWYKNLSFRIPADREVVFWVGSTALVLLMAFLM